MLIEIHMVEIWRFFN